jgi:hypothetical protein
VGYSTSLDVDQQDPLTRSEQEFLSPHSVTRSLNLRLCSSQSCSATNASGPNIALCEVGLGLKNSGIVCKITRKRYCGNSLRQDTLARPPKLSGEVGAPYHFQGAATLPDSG